MTDSGKPNSDNAQKRHQPSFVASLIFVMLSVGVVLATGVYVWWQSISSASYPDYVINRPYAGQATSVSESSAVTKFKSEEDFKEWATEALANADQTYGYGWGIGGGRGMAVPMALDMAMEESAVKAAPTAAPAAAGAEPERVSTTNVQVVGVDEPDIVKTDGQQIFFSPENRFYYWAEPAFSDIDVSTSIARYPNYQPPQIKSIKAFPPADLELEAEIEDLGEMLLYQDTLIVLSSEGLQAYDVSDPANPSKSWSWQQEDGVYLQAARLMDGQVYLVTRSSIAYDGPCPVPLFKSGDQELSIACTEIWHPVYPYASDVTYGVSVIDALTGQAGSATAFVGSANETVVYMSPENLYLATGRDGNALNFFLDFLSDTPNLAPSWVVSRLSQIAKYDLSEAAKNVELQQVLARWRGSLSSDERLQLDNDLQNSLSDYYAKHLREWESTAVVRVELDGLTVKANGSVPGRLLNQFSMDERDGYLRLATTIGSRSAMAWRFGLSGTDESVSDVYVLDGSMNSVGSVQDLGKGERIYSARFLGDRGYVVTFKETDPFYVIDLSQPTAPKLAGELKIPGYSSYLHPIGDDMVLGIGKEGSQVKLSLFDVSDSSSPSEESKYTLDEYWSDVLNNHHAFLLDDRHQAFFLPGGKGGYVFSYKGDSLSMARAVGKIQAKRAIYINDYLYIIAEEDVVVLDESDWKEVNRLDIGQ